MADLEVLVVGSGFAGLGMGARLKREGIGPFAILEQADRVGGTWRDNHYPGAACDIPSHMYSFSFAPNPRWTREFAPQHEILEYLEGVAEREGLRPHLRLGCGVVRAAFDDARGAWDVETAGGERLRAKVIVSGCGGLSRPSIPDLPGLASFGGKTMHSARWDHEFPLDGRRVGVVGTGASAIQIVPALTPRAGRLVVFQRTAPWILPKLDRPVGAREQALFARLPALQRLARLRQYWQLEWRFIPFAVDRRLMRIAERDARAHLEASVASPALRAKLVPDTLIGCKRVLLSNDYYPALTRRHVHLETDRIRAVTPKGVLTEGGHEHALDALVLATGFHAAEAGPPFPITGRGGRDLAEAWRDGAEAYKGTAVHGFPNLFLLMGPNTGLGHNSMIFMIESQIRYVAQALRAMRRRRLASVEVSAEAQGRYNDALRARFPRTVWGSGCSSWYLTRTGKNTTLWPGSTVDFFFRTRRFDAESYRAVSEA